jgi:toxin-antitoxin system PIN domain toxin
MLVDANILLYAVDVASPFHEGARRWLEDALNGRQRVGLPWTSLWAFVRIATNPRATSEPLTAVEAWDMVLSWLDAPAAWIPGPAQRHRELFGALISRGALTGNLVSDAALAATALEHGLSVVSADSDFARFPEVTWINPLRHEP